MAVLSGTPENKSYLLQCGDTTFYGFQLWKAEKSGKADESENAE
jgi:hypothetical protein